MSQKILLITPPFTQLNTPYPATPYLKGFFNKHSIPSFQLDLSIETLLSLFSKNGLKQMFLIADQNRMNENSLRIYSLQKEYVNTIESVIGFLQGKKETLAQIIAEGDFLPQASRFNNEADLEWAFGNMGYRDKARYIATLYLEDLCDFITDCVDPEFGFSRYAEQIGRYASSFDELNKRLH